MPLSPLETSSPRRNSNHHSPLTHQILNLLGNDVKSNENQRKHLSFLGFRRIDRVISDDIR